MSENTVELAAWSTGMKAAFTNHETVLFTFNPSAEVTYKELLYHRAGFETPPILARQPALSLSLAGDTSVISSTLAGLVITDAPQDLLGFVSASFLRMKLKLPQLIDLAKEYWGIELQTWDDVMALPPQTRAQLITGPLASYCQRERRSEEEVLGYTRYSWEEFFKHYTTIEQDGRILALPAIKRESFVFSRTAVEHEMAGTQVGDFFISVGAFKANDDRPYAWIQSWRGTVDYWRSTTGSNELGELILLEDEEKLKSAIERLLPNMSSLSTVSARPAYPAVEFYDAPSLLRGVKYNKYAVEQAFGLPQLQDLARELKIKNFSTRTKSELCILLGEAIAELPPIDLNPSLIFSSAGMRPVDAEGFTLTHPIAKAGRANPLSAKEWFILASRIVGQSVYAPQVPSAGASRLPTDGNFSAIFGIEPLKILKE
jgi:hypothetical protein